MKLNKTLKIFSIIFECSSIGSIVFAIYNYFIVSKKYEVIPAKLKSNINLFVIIAIISLILFLILKYVLYLRNKTKKEVTQMEMNLEENIIEKKYKDLEQEVTERVIIYKDAYDVPKDRRMNCPNCNNVIDKNAFICIKCGYLLKPIKQEKIIEKHIISKPITKSIIIDRRKLSNLLVNIGLGIAIIVCVILIISIAIERGIIS